MRSEFIPAAMTHEMRRLALITGRRRAPAAQIHIGDPGGEHVSIWLLPWHDDGIRADLLTRAIDGLETAERLVWLTRSGDLVAEDGDLAWLAAARRACARHGDALTTFHVVTRHGWTELLTDHRVEWPRVRHYQE